MSVDTDRAITIANDESLVRAIRSAQRRIVLLAPAVTKLVAEALAERWAALDAAAVSVILDADPEVYRLGYGHSDALELLERAATTRGAALNRSGLYPTSKRSTASGRPRAAKSPPDYRPAWPQPGAARWNSSQ